MKHIEYDLEHEYFIVTQSVTFFESNCSAIMFENKGNCNATLTRNGSSITIAPGDQPVCYNTQPGEMIRTIWQAITFDTIGNNPLLRVTKEFRTKAEKHCGDCEK